MMANRRRALLPLFSVMPLIGVILSAGCALVPLEEQQTPTSASYADTAYPGPGDATLLPPPPPLPSSTAQRFEGVLVTPLPDEKLQVGPLVELVTPPSDVLANYALHSRYTAKTVYPSGELVNKTYIVVTEQESGKEIAHLGDEFTHSIFEVMNDEYLIWTCDGCQALKLGSYAYRLATGEQILISERRTLYPKLDGEWVVYIGPESQSGFELRAHNLITGEDILITPELIDPRRAPLAGPRSWGGFFAVRAGKVVWATDLSANVKLPLYWGLSLYDLTQRAKSDIVLPENLGDFRQLDISDNLIVWQRSFWQGYDLGQDAYFSIPVIPPGWENVPVEKVSPVMASEGQLYWSLTVMGQEHYFSALVVPKGEAPLTQAPLPTPLGLPPTSPTQALPATALPTDVIPPTSAPPTAYP